MSNHILGIAIISTICLFSCKNRSQSSPPPSGPEPTDCSEDDEKNRQSNDCDTKTEQNSEPVDFQSQISNPVPNFNPEATIGGRFNQKPLDKLEIPEKYKDKMIFAKMTQYHRAIWMDLRKSAWSGFDSFSSQIGKSVRSVSVSKKYSDWIVGVFEGPASAKVKQVSIHQPIPSPSFLSDLDMTVNFYVTGHAAVPALANPTASTLVLAPSPLIKQPDRRDPSQAKDPFFYPIGKPKDYELVYEKNGPFLSDEIDECFKFLESLSSLTTQPDIQLQTKCQIITQSVEVATAGGVDGTFNNAFDDLYQKQSVAIWRPIPQKGYKCLGFIASNGKNDKPVLDTDFNQSIVVQTSSLNAATSCVMDKFVVRGKLHPKPLVTDGEVTIYRIVNDPEKFPDGFANGNYFYAVKGRPDALALSKAEVWVLNKKYTAFISDPK